MLRRKISLTLVVSMFAALHGRVDSLDDFVRAEMHIQQIPGVVLAHTFKAKKPRRDKRHCRCRSVSGSRTSSQGPRASRRRRCSWRALIALGTKKGGVEAMCVLQVQPAVRNEDSCDQRWLVAKANSGHEDAFGELYYERL